MLTWTRDTPTVPGCYFIKDKDGFAVGTQFSRASNGILENRYTGLSVTRYCMEGYSFAGPVEIKDPPCVDEKLKCLFCSYKTDEIEDLKEHSATCPEHPAYKHLIRFGASLISLANEYRDRNDA